MKKTAAIALMACLGATPAGAQAERSSEAAKPARSSPSSEKVRDNPAAQYVLVKTVVGQVMGVVDARATSIEPEGYNLLKYSWTAEKRAGRLGRARGPHRRDGRARLETRSWQRDLARRRLSRRAGR
jgi:hypothetical protein